MVDLITWFVSDALNPVFNAYGKQIGRFDNFDALCQGKYLLYEGNSAPPFNQLYVWDTFRTAKVPLASRCVKQAAKPNTNVMPSSAVIAATRANDAAKAAGGDPSKADPLTGSLFAPLDLGAIFGTVAPPGGASDDTPLNAAGRIATKYALIGGAGLLALLLLQRARD